MQIEISEERIELVKEYHRRLIEVEMGDDKEWNSIKSLACRICNGLHAPLILAEAGNE